MEENTTPSSEYLRGFNEGYLVAKERPDLAKAFLSIKGDSERTKGLQNGQKQFFLELAKEQRSPNAKKDHIQKQKKSKDINKDFDREI